MSVSVDELDEILAAEAAKREASESTDILGDFDDGDDLPGAAFATAPEPDPAATADVDDVGPVRVAPVPAPETVQKAVAESDPPLEADQPVLEDAADMQPANDNVEAGTADAAVAHVPIARDAKKALKVARREAVKLIVELGKECRNHNDPLKLIDFQDLLALMGKAAGLLVTSKVMMRK